MLVTKLVRQTRIGKFARKLEEYKRRSLKSPFPIVKSEEERVDAYGEVVGVETSSAWGSLQGGGKSSQARWGDSLLVFFIREVLGACHQATGRPAINIVDCLPQHWEDPDGSQS